MITIYIIYVQGLHNSRQLTYIMLALMIIISYLRGYIALSLTSYLGQ